MSAVKDFSYVGVSGNPTKINNAEPELFQNKKCDAIIAARPSSICERRRKPVITQLHFLLWPAMKEPEELKGIIIMNYGISAKTIGCMTKKILTEDVKTVWKGINAQIQKHLDSFCELEGIQDQKSYRFGLRKRLQDGNSAGLASSLVQTYFRLSGISTFGIMEYLN
ncbi:MAG: hypothetical protein EZS28_004124 [Streblomastix strix]|uniref:Uncharacterized protein n=1 Tax=Streblomastix strix TaxID=222440 RepID=A0A5J4X165_9EUKA|nr:MAG: hypothetical protein EZS28_004124 [Streblomastix strix]